MVERNNWQVTPLNGGTGTAMGGIVDAMSRPEEKASTPLDFRGRDEMGRAVRFGERWGMNTGKALVTRMRALIAVQRKRLEVVWARFMRAAPVVSADRSGWLIPPVEVSDKAVIEAARERAQASAAVRKSDQQLRALASDVYRDAEEPMEKFRSLLNVPADRLGDLGGILCEEPGRFGALKGQEVRWLRRENGRHVNRPVSVRLICAV